MIITDKLGLFVHLAPSAIRSFGILWIVAASRQKHKEPIFTCDGTKMGHVIGDLIRLLGGVNFIL